MKVKFLILFFAMGWIFSSYSSEFLGRFGIVYEIKERDLIEELYEAARKVDYEKIRKDFKKKILNYQPENLIRLKKAKKTEIYFVDYEYELPVDVKIPVNGEWKVLYKKGFKFKPLKFVKFKPIDLLIFDGSDEKQLSFVKKYFIDKKIRVKYVICDGNYREVMKKLKVPVYYLFGKMFEPMGLKYSISRVSVDLKQGKFRIDVYALDEKGNLLSKDYILNKDSYLEKKAISGKN